MLMNITAVGCFLIVCGVMIAMWRFDARNRNENDRDNTGGSKKEKGTKS